MRLAPLSGELSRAAVCFSAAFRNIFISMVYGREIGDESFDEALKLTVKGLVMQMLA